MYAYSDEPVPGGTDPEDNRKWVRDESLDDEISEEAIIRYLARTAPEGEIKRLFEEVTRNG